MHGEAFVAPPPTLARRAQPLRITGSSASSITVPLSPRRRLTHAKAHYRQLEATSRKRPSGMALIGERTSTNLPWI
jgi:hypothetical protein